jgi:hypothetical protein
MLKIISVIIITSILMVLTFSVNQNNDKLISANLNSALASGCTICHSSSAECHRIIMPDGTTHIFYGDAEDCTVPVESD